MAATGSLDTLLDLHGRDLLCSQDWSKDELTAVLDLAERMKGDRFGDRWATLLDRRTFIMLFWNPSLRTRISFETGMTELGGHALFLTPSSARFKTENQPGEAAEDVAVVLARFACGIGIRILEDQVPNYGAGHELVREYARSAEVPVINMADDRFHPCQGLADVMGWAEWYGRGSGRPDYEALKGKKLLLTWGTGRLARSWCSVQEALLMASRFGMDIALAQPPGYELDPEVLRWTKHNCEMNGRRLEIVQDPFSGYHGAHIVYSRNWVSQDAYQDGVYQKQTEIGKAMLLSEWRTDAEKMAATDNAIFSHPMPVDRNLEATDDVVSGQRSVIYDIAENRLHVQKALMALTMGDLRRLRVACSRKDESQGGSQP